MNVGMMLKCWGYIFTLVTATSTQIQIFFFPNLFMLASCLAYRVNILFKCIWGHWGMRNIQRQYFFSIILNVVIMQKYWTHITLIKPTCLNFKQHFLFGVPLQTSSFLDYSLAYTVCLHFKCIWGLRNMSKDKNLP